MSAKLLDPLKLTVSVIESPGRTVLLQVIGNFGYISYQAEYVAAPPEQSAPVHPPRPC